MQQIPIVLIGHKDHGKSTLIGRLILDTGSIRQSRVEEIKVASKATGKSFELAHLVDSFREERENEMTMDTTRAVLKGRERTYQLIDVPGHAELISQMLTGASAAQAALLVVSVEEGIREQTRQHLKIIELLGIEQLAVVINQIDKFSYKKEFFDSLRNKLAAVLTAVGFCPENIQYFPISAAKGDNVVSKSSKTDWYDGVSLMQFIEGSLKEPSSLESLPLRFLVQDKYPQDGKDILVGKVESGILRKGDDVLLLPGKIKNQVAEIRDFAGEFEEAKAGANVGITLKMPASIGRGVVISSLGYPAGVSDFLGGEVFWLRRPSQAVLRCGCGTAQTTAVLRQPELKTIKDGKKTFYKIQLKEPIAFDPQSKSILSKIVFKDKGKIIGVGKII